VHDVGGYSWGRQENLRVPSVGAQAGDFATEVVAVTRERTSLPSTPDASGSDRRTYARTSLMATAVVWTDAGGPMHYLVENLSVGGALLTGGPLLSVGESIKITLQLEKRTIGPLVAEMVRQSDQCDSVVAIAFRRLTVTDEDAIQQALLEALESERKRAGVPACSALVVDGSAPVRQQLIRDLASLGHHAVAAATPLEATMRLADPSARFDVVLVDLGSAAVDGLALLRYVAEHHPHTRRILMSGHVRLDQLRLATAAGEAHEVLAKPWDRTSLAGVVHAHGDSGSHEAAPRSTRLRG
jgi:CheY-like chemotaxis protein